MIGGVVAAGAACVVGAGVLPSLAAPTPAQVQVAAAGTPVPGQYIVTLKPGASPREEATKVKATQVQRFENVLNGFSAKLTAAQLDKLRRSSKVARIEQDQVVRHADTQRPVTWGLDRIDQRALPLSNSFTYRLKGTGVRAYVIDTGASPGHPDFGGRYQSVWKAPRFANGLDCNGHGTHVAGIIGSRTYGVAKNIQLKSLRVLDCEGSGYTSAVVAAVNWLRTNAVKPAVVNLSLTSDWSPALNDAVTALARSGVFVVAAAGNGDGATTGYNACEFSPAGAASVAVVGATGSADARTPWSNHGRCVDLHAPGLNIRSTWPGGGSEFSSGTSMAAPFVAGTAALYLTTHPKASFSVVENWLITNSTKGKVTRLPSGTANRLLFKSTM
jgi:subtilisin family serine protease